MKKTIAIIIAMAITMVATSSMAATRTLQASWTYSAVDQANITGFRLYRSDKTAAVNTIAPAARTASWQDDFTAGQCRSYYMVAVTATGESVNSEVVQLCQGIEAIVIPAGIGIKFQ